MNVHGYTVATVAQNIQNSMEHYSGPEVKNTMTNYRNTECSDINPVSLSASY